MTTITFDKKMFDYNKINEPLVAIPVSTFKMLIRNSDYLTKEDIKKGVELAKKNLKDRKTVNSKQLFSKYL